MAAEEEEDRKKVLSKAEGKKKRNEITN